MLLSKTSCFVKPGGRFFQILWPSHNILTLQCQLSLILEIQFENITKWLDPPQCNFYRTVSNFHGFGLILYCILLTICFK